MSTSKQLPMVIVLALLAGLGLAGIEYATEPKPAEETISIVSDDKPLEISIEGPDEQQPGYPVKLSAKCGPTVALSWRGDLPFFPATDNSIIFATPIEGTYSFTLAGAKVVGDHLEIRQYDHKVKIGKPKPVDPVDPPTPVDPPKPVDPPQPVGNINVMFIEESDLRTPELSMLYSSWPLRQYLDTHCEKAGPKQQTQWLWTDDDPPMTLEPWKTLIQVHRASLPWLIIAGKGGKPIHFAGPIPSKTTTNMRNGKPIIEYPLEDTLSLLKKYGGE